MPAKNNKVPMLHTGICPITAKNYEIFTNKHFCFVTETVNVVSQSIIHRVQEKTSTNIFFQSSMSDVWILTKIAANIPKER